MALAHPLVHGATPAPPPRPGAAPASYGCAMAAARYSDFEHLRFERRPDGVVVVTLDRPDVLNAADVRMHREMSEVWAVVDADPHARVTVVTGAGRAFSAGGDLAMIE